MCLWLVIMRHSRASSDAYWSRVAVLLLTLCVTNESATAVSFEEFFGYPFNESNGYTVFPRGVDLEQGLPIPVPFPYFGRTFSYAHVSVYRANRNTCLYSASCNIFQ